MSPFEMQDILLPSGTNGVKDLHISASHSSSLALFASLGKKLSVLSLDSGNLVVNYDLQIGIACLMEACLWGFYGGWIFELQWGPLMVIFHHGDAAEDKGEEVPAWSCSWDLNNSHYIYGGLQVNTLVWYLFDVGTSNANLHIASSQNGSVQFNRGKSAMQHYVAARPMFIDVEIMNADTKLVLGDQAAQASPSNVVRGLSSLYKEITDIVRKEVATITTIFPSPSEVMSILVQRVIEQRITALLDKLLEKPSLVNLPSVEEAWLLLCLGMLAMAYEKTQELARDLQAVGCGDLDVDGVILRLLALNEYRSGVIDILIGSVRHIGWRIVGRQAIWSTSAMVLVAAIAAALTSIISFMLIVAICSFKASVSAFICSCTSSTSPTTLALAQRKMQGSYMSKLKTNVKKVIWTFRLPVTKDETNIQHVRDDMMLMRKSITGGLESPTVATYPSVGGQREAHESVFQGRKVRGVDTNVYSRKTSKKPEKV
ncbi:Exocyst complex component SEC10b [Glycine soja]|uniref:Exocyst complex component SEC10b n=1 Tax=Glycine soja TaxID=3848 RepID=A0A445FD36_GLYSO|nr:Exocyst complex component SEC10b [Glycine soja]